jgi:hypothetical protein
MRWRELAVQLSSQSKVPPISIAAVGPNTLMHRGQRCRQSRSAKTVRSPAQEQFAAQPGPPDGFSHCGQCADGFDHGTPRLTGRRKLSS